MPRKPIPPEPLRDPDRLVIQHRGTKSGAQIETELAISPVVGNALLARSISKRRFPNSDATKAVALVLKAARRVTRNDLGELAQMLMAQAIAFNALQGELIEQGMAIMSKNPQAADRFFTLAIKAQNQVRCTAETIQRLVAPPEESDKNEIFEGTTNGGQSKSMERGAARAGKRRNPALAAVG